MSDEPDLSAAYALETPDDNRRLYARWAETYDAEFAEAQGYILPLQVATAFASAGGQAPVLDIGAGTGLCGAALRAVGIDPLDATDIAPEMLKVAAGKSIYRALFPGDILEGLDVEDGSYPGIVSSGTFTHGHVGPKALPEVLRLLAPGGLAVISINAEHYAAQDFAGVIENLSGATATETRCRIYNNTADAAHRMDEAVLLTIQKRL